MKRVFLLFCVFVFSFSVFSPFARADNRAVIVYIADSANAECYHSSPYCVSLSRSQVLEVTLEYAVKHGKRACHNCNPVTPDFSDVLEPTYVESWGDSKITPSSSVRDTAPQIRRIDSDLQLQGVLGLFLIIAVIFLLWPKSTRRKNSSLAAKSSNSPTSDSPTLSSVSISEDSMSVKPGETVAMENGIKITRLKTGGVMFDCPPLHEERKDRP